MTIPERWIASAASAAIASLLYWNVYTTQQLAISVEGVRVLLLTVGERVTSLETWRYSQPTVRR